MTQREPADTFPCCFCGAPIKSIMSSSSCDNCSKVWSMAYQAGRKFEREYGAVGETANPTATKETT